MTDIYDVPHIMRYEKDRHSFVHALSNHTHAFQSKCCVSDSQNFIDKENIRIKLRGHGEAEANVHAGAIGLHRRIDGVVEFSEVDELVELGVDLALGKSQDSAVE